LIDWLLKNKEWLFSGLGVSVLLGAPSILRFLRRRKPIEGTTVVVRVENTSEVKISPSRTVAVERISPLTPEEVQKSIEDAPPLQRDAVARRYIGLKVEWDTEFAGADEREGVVRLYLVTHKTRIGTPIFVWCNVKLDDYRELSIIRENANIRISGTIETAKAGSISLSDARLTFLAPGHGA
jgi:hypothetical protein